MKLRERSGLYLLNQVEILGECIDAVLRVRIQLDCTTNVDDPADKAVNVHLAHVLAQGFTANGRNTFGWHVIDLRQLMMQKVSPLSAQRRAWEVATVCSFVFSQHVTTRPSRSGPASRSTYLTVVSLGRQAYDAAATFDPVRGSERREVAHRMSGSFEDYGYVARQAGMILGFHENLESLIDPRFTSIILDEVFDARRRYEESGSRSDWQRLRAAIAHYRQYRPDFVLALPPAPTN